jgi:hypothetical protein
MRSDHFFYVVKFNVDGVKMKKGVAPSGAVKEKEDKELSIKRRLEIYG